MALPEEEPQRRANSAHLCATPLKSVCAYGQPTKAARNVRKLYLYFPKKSRRGGKVRPPLRYLLVDVADNLDLFWLEVIQRFHLKALPKDGRQREGHRGCRYQDRNDRRGHQRGFHHCQRMGMEQTDGTLTARAVIPNPTFSASRCSFHRCRSGPHRLGNQRNNPLRTHKCEFFHSRIRV